MPQPLLIPRPVMSAAVHRRISIKGSKQAWLRLSVCSRKYVRVERGVCTYNTQDTQRHDFGRDPLLTASRR